MRPASLVVPLVLLTGCGSPAAPTTDDTDSPVDSATDTDDDSLEDIRVHGYTFALAWDDSTGQTRSYTVDGTESPSTVSLVLGTADFRSRNDTTTSCTITYDANGLSEADFSDTEGWSIGLSFTLAAAKVISDDCTPRVGSRFAPRSFDDTPTADVAAWTIDVGIGEDVHPDIVADDLDDTRAEAVGGAIHLLYIDRDDTDAEREGSAIATLGYEVDASFVVTQDNDGLKAAIAKASVPTKTGIASGYYEIDAVYLWFFDASD